MVYLKGLRSTTFLFIIIASYVKKNASLSVEEPSSSSFKCVDNKDFRIDNVERKSCEWLGNRMQEERRRTLCNSRLDVRQMCQLTCGSCLRCEDDSSFRLEKEGSSKPVKCKWITKKPGNLRMCKKLNMHGESVSEHCPNSCQKCRTKTGTPSTEERSQEGPPSPSSSSKPPNILIILADDVGQGDIPFYWNSSQVDMPNIQRLTEMGVSFYNAHSTPLCAPSRYMLLSGNYPHRGTR